MSPTQAGFPAYIYRAPGIPYKQESSNIFGDVHQVTIIKDNLLDQKGLPKFLMPEKEMPAVCIKKRTSPDLLYAEPVKPGNYEFGGAFIYSEHPSFYNLSPYPIPLHDRPKPIMSNVK